MIAFFQKNSKKMKEKGNGFRFEPTKGDKKSKTLTTLNGSRMDDNFIKIEGCDIRKDEGLRIKPNGKTGTLMARAREDESCGQLVKIEKKIITHELKPRNGKGIGGKGHLCKTDQKSYCVDTGNGQAIEYSSKIRRLTPIECERLQTVPDNYTNHVSDSQRYKMLGNGWTIDVIAHILNYIK